MPTYIEGEFYMARYFGDKTVATDTHLRPYLYSKGNLYKAQLPDAVPLHWSKPINHFFIKMNIDKEMVFEGLKAERAMNEEVLLEVKEHQINCMATHVKDVEQMWDDILEGTPLPKPRLPL